MRKTAIQTTALVFGVVFFLVGVLGFIPGVTTNYDQLEIAGHESGALLLGIFMVSVLHNIVHILFGLWGFAAASTVNAAKGYLIIGGVIYLVLWLYGLFAHSNADLNFIPVNGADNWLHFLLGVVMLIAGAALGRGVAGTVGDRRVTDGDPV